MKKIQAIGLSALILFIFLLPAKSQTFDMQSIADASLKTNVDCTDWQTTNYGTATVTTISHWTWFGPGCGEGAMRGLWKFNLNVPTNHTMLYDNRATLHLLFPTGSTETHFYTGEATSNRFYVNRVTQNWGETTVTWNSQPAVTTTSQVLVPSCTPNPSTADYTVDISNIAIEWICNGAPNYGVRLRMENETQLYRRVSFTNREYANPLRRSFLRLQYAQIEATSSNSNICMGNNFSINCNLTNTNNPSQYTYQWKHLNSSTVYNTKNVTNPQHQVGLNTYVVVVSNPWCQTATDTVTVFATVMGNITVSPSNPSICAGNSVNLTATGATSYVWSNGLGNTATVSASPTTTTTYQVTGTSGPCSEIAGVTVTVIPNANATINPHASVCINAAPFNMSAFNAGGTWSGSGITNPSAGTFDPSVAGSGTHTITYTITGACGDIGTTTITVYNLPSVTLNASSTNICDGDNVTLNAGGAGNYSWSPSGSGSSHVASPTTTTTWTITGTDVHNCSNTATVTVNVTAAADATISAVAPMCADATPFNLTAVDAGGTWTGNGITNPSTGTFDPSAAGAGTHTITYEIAGACGDTGTTTITVYALPSITASASPQTICLGQEVILTANGGINYSWGNSGTGSPIAVFPTANTTYTVTGTDDNSCSNTAQVTVMIIDNFDATISSAGPFCSADNSITLTAADPGGTWSGTGITNPSTGLFDPSTAGAGNHIITYTIPGPCGNTGTTSITVFESPIISATKVNESCTGAMDGSITISVSGGTTPYNYNWNPQGSGTSTSELGEGTYTIITTDANGCQKTVIVSLGDPYIICDTYVPHVVVSNIFSPNGDGQNDMLYVRGEGIVSLEFIVYTRWGEKVFETTNQNTGWDGTYKGKLMDPGVFVYSLKATLSNHKSISLSGDITLVK